MQLLPIKTRTLKPPKDNLYDVLDKYLPRLREGDILVITSKILAIHQGRTIKIGNDSYAEKNRLIKKEADWYVPPEKRPGQHWHLTIKNNTLIADAGIDKSNGNGYYILWPKKLKLLLREIRSRLKTKYHLKKIAVIAVDSHLVPLHAGTVGIATGFYGIEPLRDYRGTPDIFGRELEVTRANVVDALAAISTLVMGEGKEQIPMVVIRGFKGAKFTDKDTMRQLFIHPQVDVYRPLLKVYRKNK